MHILYLKSWQDFRRRYATGRWYEELKFGAGNQVWGVTRIEVMSAFLGVDEIMKWERKDS